MASSAGERRRAFVRRSGMTVLGKVPRPMNLPSLRSENHGMEPNVEIITTWGSRPSSSSASNAWGSSTLSPNTDGGTSSPSRLSGRLSSGGTGNRPSTAGSDRAHESGACAWAPNSRPSSASGALTSNQTLGTSLRPHSAESGPGSSQLSRFAEPLSDNSVAWGGAGTLEKLGGRSFKKDGFSLASGDFPTLGSEENNSGKVSQDHYCRTGSSSSIAAPARGDGPVSENVKSEIVNGWTKESSPYVEDGGIQPDVEKWQGGPKPYPCANISSQHLEHWHGTPMGGPPGGVWFRGPPGGPPYGTPVPPGGFPMEPFPYYHPQVPPAFLASSQPGHLSAAAPRGHHPKNGDFYRPSMSEAYIRPGVPIGPGFYHGPVTYEGYYAPFVGCCNPSERDNPSMGMAAGPPVYNRYSSQNTPDPVNPYTCCSGSGSSGKPLEQVGSVPHDNQRPSKVMLKRNNGWNGQDEQKSVHVLATNASYPEEEDNSRSLWENDWETDYKNAKDMNSRTTVLSEQSSKAFDNQGNCSSGLSKQKLPEIEVDAKTVGRSSINNLETATSALSEVPQLFPDHPKGSTFIQKMEGLNDVSSVSHNEDRKNGLDRVNAKANIYKTEADATATTGTATRRATNGMQGRVDYSGKTKFNAQEVDGWRKESLVTGSSNKHGGESVAPMFNTSDCQTQRTKMRELARQKFKLLQEEEEERVREQKAKACAKLEDLNRHTQVVEGFTLQLVDISSDGTIQFEKQPMNLMEPAADARKTGVLTAASVSKPDGAQISESSMAMGEDSAVLSRKFPLEIAKNAFEEPAVTHNQSLPSQRNNTADDKTSQQDHDSVSRQKRTGYKEKQIIWPEKNPSEMSISASTTEASRSHSVAMVDASASTDIANNEISPSCESSLLNPSVTAESSLHHKCKNNRGNKNKQKLEETSSVAALPLPVPKEYNPVKVSIGSDKVKTCESKANSRSLQLTDSKDTVPSSEQKSLPGKEGHIRVNNQWRPQHSRRMPGNPQAVKEELHCRDAVVWAPVHSRNKMEVAVEVSQKTTVETASVSKSDLLVQNNSKSKRAEMERYVPKPVAKELAQQVSSQQLASLPNHVGSDEAVESGSHCTADSQPASSVVVMASSAVEARNGEGKQNKLAKAHGSWQRRVPADLTPVESSQDVSPSNLSENVEKPIEHSRTIQPGMHLSKEQPKHYDEWNPPDGWNIPPYWESVASVTFPVVKDVGAMSRGKRQTFRGQRGMGNNPEFDHRNLNSRENDKTYTQSPSLEMSQLDGGTVSEENLGVGERLKSHWRSKSQTNLTPHQRGSRPNWEQNVTEELDKLAKESTSWHGMSMGENGIRANNGQALSGTSIIADAPTAGHQDGERERKLAVKGHSHSLKSGPAKPVESASSENVDIQHKGRLSSGFDKNGNPNSHFVREHESGGVERSSAGPDNRQQNPSAIRERQSCDSNYEYQPVGPKYNNKLNSSEGQTDDSQSIMGSRARDKGHDHSRRGKLLWAPKSEC